jgi:hypothetical protein
MDIDVISNSQVGITRAPFSVHPEDNHDPPENEQSQPANLNPSGKNTL